MTFACKDGQTLGNGDSMKEICKFLDTQPQIIAVGANCTKPEHISELIEVIKSETKKPIITYPNSGEIYDGITKTWSDSATTMANFFEYAKKWRGQGASAIGGCCRTNPEYIKGLNKIANEHNK